MTNESNRPGAMTGPEHYKEGERLLDSASEWMDADFGWMASMSTDERIARRAADIAEAQAHFAAALAAATVEAADLPARRDAWYDAVHGGARR